MSKCDEIFRVPITWRDQTLGAFTMGKCKNDALPTMLTCWEHAPREAMALCIRMLHKENEKLKQQLEQRTR